MNDEQLLAEIREANLTYLMLAQTLIRQDKAEAVFPPGPERRGLPTSWAPCRQPKC